MTRYHILPTPLGISWRSWNHPNYACIVVDSQYFHDQVNPYLYVQYIYIYIIHTHTHACTVYRYGTLPQRSTVFASSCCGFALHWAIHTNYRPFWMMKAPLIPIIDGRTCINHHYQQQNNSLQHQYLRLWCIIVDVKIIHLVKPAWITICAWWT